MNCPAYTSYRLCGAAIFCLTFIASCSPGSSARIADLEAQLESVRYEAQINKGLAMQFQQELDEERSAIVGLRTEIIQTRLASMHEASEWRIYLLKEKLPLLNETEVAKLIEQEKEFRAKMANVSAILDRAPISAE